MDTKKIAVIPVDENLFGERKDVELKKLISKTNEIFAENLSTLYKEFQTKFQKKEWVYLNRVGQSEGVYYVHDITGLMPDLDVHGCNYAYAYRPINYNDSNILNPSRLKFADFQGVIPTSDEARKLFNDNISYFRDGNGNIRVCGSTQSGLTVDSGSYYMWTNNSYKYNVYSYNGSQTSYFWVIPIYKFNLSNPSPQKVIWTWLEYDLAPKDFPSKKSEQLFITLKNLKEYFKFQGDKITFDEKKIYDAVKAGTKFSFLNLDALKGKTVNDKQAEDIFREELLTCDERRVGLDRYD